MNVANERTRSLWMETPVPRAAALERSANADAVIVGSGIAGLSVAYELAARGASVMVVDRGEIGSGMTARTTAHLASALDDFYFELIKSRDEEMARLLHESLGASIDRAEAICTAEGIDCDFARLDGILFCGPETPRSDLEKELKACRKIGVPVSAENTVPFAMHNDAFSLRFPRQGRFHPLKYLNGLASAIQQRRGQLFADTCVTSVDEKDGQVVVKTSAGYELRAKDVVVATNSPIIDRVAVHTKQAPYRTYVIAAKLPRGSLPDALYWDTLEAYHYVRLQPLSDEHDIVIIGGEDHKSGEADDGAQRFAALEVWSRARIPQMQEITHRWSGQVLEPVDYCGFVGRNPGNDHVFMVSGDSGQGITNGIVAGMLISDLITSGDSPWREVYDPSRKVSGTSSLGEFVSENLTPVKNLAEYVTAGNIDSTEQLKPGEGGLYRSGLKKVAACRDLKGVLHARSATCTHLGCVVHWNSTEQCWAESHLPKTDRCVVHWNSTEQCWDCPCHGSQFAPDGTALSGPAITALADAEDSVAEAAE